VDAKLGWISTWLAAALLASCSRGGSGGSGNQSAPPPLSTFVAFGSSSSTVTLAWSAAPGATGYLLERRTGGGAYAAVQALGPGAEGFLDGNLARLTAYEYRITAAGATADAVRQYGATTTDVDPLVTGTDAPLDAPVQQAVGSAGGTVALADGSAQVEVPAGALPDGSTVTLQPVVNPLPQEPNPALSVSADQPFAQPFVLRFQLPTGSSADSWVAAVKDPGGAWLTSAAVRDAVAGTLAVTLPADAAPAVASLHAAAGSAKRTVGPLRRVYVHPHQTSVRANTSNVPLEAQAPSR
jgi:hypothetical protein